MEVRDKDYVIELRVDPKIILSQWSPPQTILSIIDKHRSILGRGFIDVLYVYGHSGLEL